MTSRDYEDQEFPPIPLRSNAASREYEYEADSDSLDSEEAGDIGTVLDARREEGSFDLEEESEEPLLQGLLAESAARASADNKHKLPSFNAESLLPNKGAGLFAGVANMANSILGAGIVGLPYATKQAGFFTGIILFLVLGAVTDWTIRLTAINAKLSGTTTYIGSTEAAFGYGGRAACTFFQAAFAFIGMCAFCMILGDSLPHVFSSVFPSVADSHYFGFLFSRTFIICFFTITISYPLSLYRDIERLSKASALALVSMCTILSVVAVHGPQLPPELKGDPSQRWTIIAPGVPAAVGIISFAFVCHHNTLLIYGSLSLPTLDKFGQVTHVSVLLSVIASLFMAICGYLTFTDKTQGNILNCFPADDLLTNLARFCFGLNMFTTLPLECFVLREVFETFFFGEGHYDARRHFIFTTVSVALALIVSLLASDLGLVLEVGGGLSASLLAFVFPAANYLVLAKDMSALERWTARGCCLFGTAIFFATLAKAIFALL